VWQRGTSLMAAKHRATVPAFGGPVNLVRLFLLGAEVVPVVCIVCQTMNSRAATLCIGCAGKLPAWFAAVGEPADSKRGSRSSATDDRVRCGTRCFRALTKGAASLVLTLCGLFVWFALHHMEGDFGQSALRAAPAFQDVTVQTATGPFNVVKTDAPNKISAIAPIVTAWPRNEQLRSNSSAPSSLLAQPDAQRAFTAHDRAKYGSPKRVVQRHLRDFDPLASCRPLWFLARVVCSNDTCAQAKHAGHPQCADVVAQRRVDEARRDAAYAN